MKDTIDGAGYIKLLAQPSFSLKPMIEEAVVPSTSTMSTYSCYLRKGTSYVACWSGCIPLKVLRRYRKRDDVEWIKLYNYCMSEATLRNTHLFLKAKDFAALCGILPSSEKLQAAMKKLTNQRFLNNVASSTSDSTEASSGVRLANTGLFTDFEIVKTSNTRNKINIQSALGDQYAWANIHHVSVEEKNPEFECRCLEVIAMASEYVESLSKRGDDARAGTSIHIWFSFAEYVQWSRNGVNSTFSIDDERVKSIAKALSGLVCNSFAPVFVSLCSCSDFFHGDEMQLGKIMRRIASELTKLGVPVTHNPAMWSELANFIDYKRVTINPTSIDTTAVAGEPWDSSAAFACIDKFLFREKMLFACVVGDDTISSFESNLDEFPLDGVLTQLPTELSLTEAAANCERISTDALRKSKTVNPLTNVDFDAINPKVMYKEDRFWYRVPVRSPPLGEGFFQDDPQRMVMCSRCSASKGTSNEFDVFTEAARFCPNCASNFCRKFYFNESAPDRADIVLRWAASIILHEKELSPNWGLLDPANDIRTWIYETIRTFRTHQSGVGKFVSHFGTTRMNARSAANAMAQGQGKQLTVEKHQTTRDDGQTQEYYQFSYDHGNRMYSDYMKKLFSTPEIFQLIGCDEPTEEVLGDCVEVCLGILRVAIMYEGHGPGIFKWKDVNGTLTGLEHSLMMYNASAYPSGLKNRKANPSKSKGKAYTFDECQDVPITSVPKRKSPVIKNEEYPEIADALMSDATLITKLTEGKTLGPASSSTEANRNEPVAAPGMDAAKRRKVIPQTQMQDIFGGMLNFIEQAISTDSGCLNCMSNDHKVEQCPNEGAVEWMNLLIGVRDGINVRNPAESSDMVIDLVEDDVPDSRLGNIAFHNESRSLLEIVGEDEIVSAHIGGKDPRKMGFRRQGYLYDTIREHMKETQYIPQIGHTSAVDQTGMTKYQNWTAQVQYGKIVAIEARMAVFADPAWGDCQFDVKMLREPNYNHATLQDYTRRWNKVLRHDIGHKGPSAHCDELGWVSIEEFIRNDHAWPWGNKKAYDYRTDRYDEEVIRERRGLLMEGYWYTLNCRPVKRRLMIVAQVAVPTDMPRIMELEDNTIYDAQRMIECGGFIRPVAIRATSGHSLSGDHKYPLAVNVDFESMNVRFTKELAFKLAGGYHVTKVDSLLSIIQKGIIPGGGSGGRDHAFFGEYAPWDNVNSCTLSYLGHGNENLLVLYVPVSRLLKYRSNFTYNADVIVRDVVPFHEVQEAWIVQRSYKKGMTARNPRKITSNKIVDEVVCQCEYAVRTVPPAIFRIVMDDLIKEAERVNRDDVVLGLEGRWAPYNDNPRDGTAAANLGAQLVLARYDLFPELCARNRMCPNCTLECPKTLLSCPQCKGKFVSSGIINRSAPVDVILTREELDRMVKEREESLKRAKFPKEEEIAEQEAIVIPDDPPEATFATGDVSMGGQMDDDTREEVQEAVVDADDEFTSFAFNQERMNADLADYDEGSAFSVDPNERISRFILFKIADFVVNAYSPWHRFRFRETDKSRVELMKEGVRLDITGAGHMMLLADPGVGGFDMEDGVPKTVDDETARRHYQAKFDTGNSNFDGDEMLKRYRFSVVITKLLEALYRRGYDLDGEFKGMVKTCNSVREDQETETTNPRHEGHQDCNEGRELFVFQPNSFCWTICFQP